MISISVEKVQDVIDSFEDEINRHVNSRLKKLRKFKTSQGAYLNQSQYDYLDQVITDLPKLVKASPAELEGYKAIPIYGNPPDKTPYCINGDKENKESFQYRLLYYIAYSDLRTNFLPQYFQAIGIKACIYCNSQLTISTVVSEGVPKARFEVDHYYPKSKYPCFAISLFNFFPSCSTCNQIKSNDDLNFELYSTDVNSIGKSPYRFEIKEGLLAEYLLSQDQKVIDIEFVEEPGSEGIKNAFDIEGIYATQKDVAEELIWKRQVYSADYKDFLRNEFNVLYKDPDIANRLIVGNYIREKDIHKRPMAKFMQDIARQIGLIEEDLR